MTFKPNVRTEPRAKYGQNWQVTSPRAPFAAKQAGTIGLANIRPALTIAVVTGLLGTLAAAISIFANI